MICEEKKKKVEEKCAWLNKFFKEKLKKSNLMPRTHLSRKEKEEAK